MHKFHDQSAEVGVQALKLNVCVIFSNLISLEPVFSSLKWVPISNDCLVEMCCL